MPSSQSEVVVATILIADKATITANPLLLVVVMIQFLLHIIMFQFQVMFLLQQLSITRAFRLLSGQNMLAAMNIWSTWLYLVSCVWQRLDGLLRR
jgi:hypothetical protein